MASIILELPATGVIDLKILMTVPAGPPVSPAAGLKVPALPSSQRIV